MSSNCFNDMDSMQGVQHYLGCELNYVIVVIPNCYWQGQGSILGYVCDLDLSCSWEALTDLTQGLQVDIDDDNTNNYNNDNYYYYNFQPVNVPRRVRNWLHITAYRMTIYILTSQQRPTPMVIIVNFFLYTK